MKPIRKNQDRFTCQVFLDEKQVYAGCNAAALPLIIGMFPESLKLKVELSLSAMVDGFCSRMDYEDEKERIKIRFIKQPPRKPIAYKGMSLDNIIQDKQEQLDRLKKKQAELKGIKVRDFKPA